MTQNAGFTRPCSVQSVNEKVNFLIISLVIKDIIKHVALLQSVNYLQLSKCINFVLVRYDHMTTAKTALHWLGHSFPGVLWSVLPGNRRQKVTRQHRTVRYRLYLLHNTVRQNVHISFAESGKCFQVPKTSMRHFDNLTRDSFCCCCLLSSS